MKLYEIKTNTDVREIAFVTASVFAEKGTTVIITDDIGIARLGIKVGKMGTYKIDNIYSVYVPLMYYADTEEKAKSICDNALGIFKSEIGLDADFALVIWNGAPVIGDKTVIVDNINSKDTYGDDLTLTWDKVDGAMDTIPAYKITCAGSKRDNASLPKGVIAVDKDELTAIAEMELSGKLTLTNNKLCDIGLEIAQKYFELEESNIKALKYRLSQRDKGAKA